MRQNGGSRKETVVKWKKPFYDWLVNIFMTYYAYTFSLLTKNEGIRQIAKLVMFITISRQIGKKEKEDDLDLVAV